MPQIPGIGLQHLYTILQWQSPLRNHISGTMVIDIKPDKQRILDDSILASIKELPTVHVGKGKIAITIKAGQRIANDF